MLDLATLQTKFSLMGAALEQQPWMVRRAGSVALDVEGAQGFSLRVHPERAPQLDALVLDVQPSARHLLLMVRNDPVAPGQKSRFLCGHDERDWFVAAVPGRASTVTQAMDALKPALVVRAQQRAGVRPRDRNRRRNDAFVRQGEWFFLPEPGLVVEPYLVLRNEPLSRGNGSKPHLAEQAYRRGGELVYVSQQHRSGLTQRQYEAWLRAHPRSGLLFRAMRRNPGMFVRGRIRHADHRTVELRVWHRVVMNTEGQAPWANNVAFLD